MKASNGIIVHNLPDKNIENFNLLSSVKKHNCSTAKKLIK